MGVCVLVLGYSGSGKSYALRNFEPDEVGIFNVIGKRLPFRKQLRCFNKPTYEEIAASMRASGKLAYVIDDANYLMAFENFAKAKQKGYEKFTQMAVNFERLLETANEMDDDTIVYFLMHPDTDEAGRVKPKTIGRMLDNQLTVEGMFPIVLMAEKDDKGYYLRTVSDGNDPAKAPPEMFAGPRIDNDLRAVDSAIREYYQMEPIGGKA